MQQRWDISVKEVQRNPQYTELNDERNDVHDKLNALTFIERRQLLWDSWSKTLTFVKAKTSRLKKIQNQTPKASAEEFKAAFDMYYEAQACLETFFDTIFDADTMPLFFAPGECAVRDVLTKDQWMTTHLVEKTKTSFLATANGNELLQAIETPNLDA